MTSLGTLKIGSTTQAEARKEFGKPWETELGEVSVETYQLGSGQLFSGGFLPAHLARRGGAVDITTLFLVFKQNGALESTNIHRWTGGEKVEGFMVNRIGAKFNAEDLTRVVPGKTTLSELESWFGPPVVKGPNAKGTTSARWFSTKHEYGGYIHLFQHQSLFAVIGSDGILISHRFNGEFKPTKK